MDLSIIIPTYNRKDALKNCLDSLCEQTTQSMQFEIIIVDDGSTDGTQEMVNDIALNDNRIKLISQQHEGPAAARNLGTKYTRGKIIGFIDDDCVVEPSWAQKMVIAHHNHPDVVAVGGETLLVSSKVHIMASQFLSTCSIEVELNGSQEVIFFPTCNVSFKKYVFTDHLFDEKFPLPGGEDLEFFWRLFKAGYRFRWDKNIKVFHKRQDSLKSFIKQAYIYGRGNFLVQRIHQDHPLLRELHTGPMSFWGATVLNFMKIPRFCYLLGRRLIRENSIKSFSKQWAVYLYFSLHKIVYIVGNIREFISKKKTTKIVPRLLICDITHRCNLSCRMCDIWFTHEPDLGIEHIKKILLEARQNGITEITLSGGEPLLREDIFEIFDYAKEIGIGGLGLLSNGLLISDYWERIQPYLLDRIISPVVSFDSLQPQVHNLLRNSQEAWGKTKNSLEALSFLKKQYPYVSFHVISIIFNKNLTELTKLCEFVKRIGADSIQFQPLLPNNLNMAQRKKGPFWVSQELWPILDDAIGNLIDLKNRYPEFIRNSRENLCLMKKYYRGLLTKNDVRCSSADKTVLISNQGHCATCFSVYGDMKKDTLQKIFSSNNCIQARKKVEKCSWPCLLPCFCDQREVLVDNYHEHVEYSGFPVK